MKPDVIITAPLNLTAAAGSQSRRFEILAYDGGKLSVDSYPLPVVVDLAGLEVRAGFPLLINHKNDVMTTLGQEDRHVNDGQTLLIAGRVTGDTGLAPAVNHILEMSAQGHQFEASIGAKIDDALAYVVPAGETKVVNGREQAGPFIYAPKAVIRETSVLPMGADPKTQVNLAATAAGLLKGVTMTFDEWLTSLGLDAASLTDGAKTALQAQFDAQHSATNAAAAANPDELAQAGEEPKPAPNPTDTQAAAALNLQAAGTVDVAAQLRQDAAAELRRQAEIRTRCAGDDRIMQAAIAGNWTPEQAELHMLRAQARTQAPAGHVRSHDSTCNLQALQGAMILRAGGRLDHPSYQTPRALAMNVPGWLRAGLNTDQRQRAMESAWRFRDMSMIDLAREACRIDGRDVPHSRQEMLQAAFSGSSLTSIFTTNVNTQILSTYEEAGDTTQEWTKETEVADFKTNERPRMAKGPDLVKLPSGGTADHMTRADVGESYKIARYAKQFTVDEQDMINDAFNALADTPREMGLAAARLRPRLIYAILLANPNLAATSRALFNATDGNLDTTAALAIATLKAAVQAMFLFQENGVNLGLHATHLLVPATLEFTAYELLESAAVVIAGTAGSVTERAANNALTKKSIKVVPSADLENGVVDPDSGTTYSGSASTWYLACAMAHTIEVAYLRGTGRSPQVRSFKLDKGQWGVGWDVNMDIGAKALDWRGLHKATA